MIQTSAHQSCTQRHAFLLDVHTSIVPWQELHASQCNAWSAQKYDPASKGFGVEVEYPQPTSVQAGNPNTTLQYGCQSYNRI